MTPQDFQLLSTMLHERSGLALTPEKVYLLESRLLPIAHKWQLEGMEGLLNKLRRNPEFTLLEDITEAMTTNETLFFRDTNPFNILRDTLLPTLAAERRQQGKIRIWSAACSSGQEPYSISMILEEEKPKYPTFSFDILATDLSREILAKAQEGLYSQFEVQRGLPIQLLTKYFTKENERWRIASKIRNMVQFRQFNLLHDPVNFGKFDIIFCRNVLIYFDAQTKAKIIDRMANILAPDGYLLLGGSESLLGITKRFTPASGLRGVYQKV